MRLGRTFDYSKSAVGNDIFPRGVRENPSVTPHHITEIKYSTIREAKDVRDVLDVSGQLSLQVMAGIVDISGQGSYLKTSSGRGNFVEVLAKISFHTITKSINDNTRPANGWERLPNIIGQHYVRSITYGGYLIASMKLEVKNKEGAEEIKAKLEADFGVAGLGVGVKGQFELIKNSVEDMSRITISYTATAPLSTIPTDIDSLVQVIEDFPKAIAKVNSGHGVPIQAEIVELTQLDSADTAKLTFIMNRAVQMAMTRLEWMYNDLRVTHGAILKFLEKNQLLGESFERKFGEIYFKILRLTQIFNDVIASIDLNAANALSLEGTSQFQRAFEAYGQGRVLLHEKYERRYKTLASRFKKTFRKNKGTKWQEDINRLKARLDPLQHYFIIDELSNSNILSENNAYLSKLKEWLPVAGPWSLCYRVLEHENSASHFHSRCDNKGATVTIVSSGSYVFGGFADKSWGGPERQIASDKSFMFSLVNPQQMSFKAPIHQNNAQALFTKPTIFSAFGREGGDFYLSDRVIGYTTDFGATYKLPSGYVQGSSEAKSLLAGDSWFLISGYEVFYLR